MQDLSKSKFSNSFYFEGKNVRIIATDTQGTGSLMNEKGNSLILTVPVPTINYTTKVITYGSKTLSFKTSELSGQSNEQIIIGHSNSRNYLVLFTTDNNGFDCIWTVNYETYDITLRYMRDMNFSTSHPIQVINNFENKNIDKVYWVDGNNQMRFINLEHSIANEDAEELIDVPVDVIDMTGKVELSQPVVTSISSGGIHTSGMIQYGYNLYRLNSSQTKISPLSELVALDKQSLGGGAVNEIVGSSPIISITGIDTSYTNIRVYAIKYTSYNETPSVSLIDDRRIPSSGQMEIYDDGNVISTLSLEEFTFLGSDIVIPYHINTKFNRMFFANYKEINFNLDLDLKAYSFNSSGVSKIYKDLYLNNGVPAGTEFTISSDADYDNPILLKHDSVNLNYGLYKFQKDGSTYGGEGKYIKYELAQSTSYNEDAKYFKDNEIYRIGIYFYNSNGQTSEPKWIADFKAREGNLQGNYNILKVTLKPFFYTWLANSTFTSDYDKPIGYKVIIAERTINDKTILANGLISPMMIDNKSNQEGQPLDYVKNKSKSLPKLPNILVRNCNTSSLNGIVKPLRKAAHLSEMSTLRENPDTEVQRAYYGNKDTSGRLYQFNSMMQMYSPEIMFGNTIPLSESTRFVLRGCLVNHDNKAWGRTYDEVTTQVSSEVKAEGGISSAYSTSKTIISGDERPFSYGLIAHPKDSNPAFVNHNMFYRVYGNTLLNSSNNNLYKPAPNQAYYDVYGKPEITEKGQSGTNYNNDANYRYLNSLEEVLTDGDSSYKNDGTYNRQIITIQSYGNRCITFVLGNNNVATNNWDRPTAEYIYAVSGIYGDNNGLYGEFVRSDSEIYLGNIYGGNSYEDKRRTNYIEIGSYVKIDQYNPTITISSPGDTFVKNFRFARIVRKDTTVLKQGHFILEEIVDFLTETTVDLKNRNDLSLKAWDVRFQPQDAEYHSYNKVYSQLPTLSRKRSTDYNVKKNYNMDTSIISSKLKSAGEIIDNWTDLSVNDVMTLDGKHGRINSLTSFNDEMYAIQDKALAYISVNPRIQVQGQDGLSVQLGSGNVLDRYKYISTDSGTLNKWSVVSSSKAMYFYDLLNRGLVIFSGTEDSLSDKNGMHTYFYNNSVHDTLKIDNPILKTGISSGYDHVNNEMFMTLHQGDKSFTIGFNEGNGQFTSFYDYMPSSYMSKGEYFITTDPTNKKIYRQYAGEYNKFYEVYYPSSITLNVNPEPHQDCVFDNINFKSEVYLNGVDQVGKTLTKIQAYNDYQDSGLVPLIVGRNNNLRRKFRDWNALIPRTSRNRIRAPWIKLKLQFDNTSNYKFILHDSNIYYTV